MPPDKFTPKDIEEVLKVYELGQLVSFEKNPNGFQNTSFFVTTTIGKYVVRISKKTQKKPKDIIFEIELLNHLGGFPVPEYIKDMKGKYVNKLKGKNVSVYKFLEGDMPKKHSSWLMKQSAYFLAKFHRKTWNFSTDIDRFAYYSFPDERIVELSDFLNKKIPECSQVIAFLVRQLFRNRLSDELPKGPLHCDLKRENILVKGEKLSAVLDFDNCQMGPYLFDVANTIMWFCVGPKGLDKKKMKDFVSHYEKYRKLTGVEKRNLMRAVRFALAAHVIIDYYVYVKGFITKDYFDFGRRYFLNALRRLH